MLCLLCGRPLRCRNESVIFLSPPFLLPVPAASCGIACVSFFSFPPYHLRSRRCYLRSRQDAGPPSFFFRSNPRSYSSFLFSPTITDGRAKMQGRIQRLPPPPLPPPPPFSFCSHLMRYFVICFPFFSFFFLHTIPGCRGLQPIPGPEGA